MTSELIINERMKFITYLTALHHALDYALCALLYAPCALQFEIRKVI